MLASTENKLIRAPATPTCRARSRVEESDSETKVETPPRRKNKSQQERWEEKKKKQRAERKTDQPAVTRMTATLKWKEGNTFKPGMEWDTVLSNHKRAFIQARWEFMRSGTAEAKAYTIDSLKKMVEKAADMIPLRVNPIWDKP